MKFVFKTIRIFFILLISLALCIFSTKSFAVVNVGDDFPGVSYSGVLYQNNELYEGYGCFKYAFVDGSGTYLSAAISLDENNQPTEYYCTDDIVEGFYSIPLSDLPVSEIAESLSGADSVYLRIWFWDGESATGFGEAFTPDIKLSSSITAYYARNSKLFNGLSLNDLLGLVDGHIEDADILASQISGTISTSQIEGFSSNAFSFGTAGQINTVTFGSSGNGARIRFNPGTDDLEYSIDGGAYSSLTASSGGDVTAVSAGAGLSGGGNDGDVSLSLNTSTDLVWANSYTYSTTGTALLFKPGVAPAANTRVLDFQTSASSTYAYVDSEGDSYLKSLILSGTSTGSLVLNPFSTGAGNTSETMYMELAAGGSNYVSLKAPDAITSNVTLTLPADDGDSGEFLTTNGSGVLTWESAGGGDVTAVVAGDGLKTGGTSGDVTVDIDVSDFAGAGLEDDGSENLRITAATAGSGLTGGAGSALAVGAGNGITVNADDVALDLSYSTVWTAIQTFSKMNNAGASAASTEITGTLGIMNGSDTYIGLEIDLTNADHTGASNTVTGIHIDSITGDDEAAETGIEIENGFDVGLNLHENSLSMDETDGNGDVITIQAPATIGSDITLTLPATTGTLALTSDISAAAQNLFATINAPNGTDPAADSATDTLNLADGNAVTITGDSSNDTVTVAVTANSINQDEIGAAVTMADGDLIDLGAILHDDNAAQGFRLPNVGATPTDVTGTNEGYIAWNEADNELLINDGSTWIAIDPSAAGDVTAVVAGDGLKTGGTSGDVTVDIDVSDFAGTGLEDDGSENLRIAAAAGGNGLIGGAGSALAVGAGNGISVGANDVALGTLTSSWSIGDPYDIILDDAASELQIMESSGDTYRGTIDVGNLGDDRTYTFPDASGTIALTSDLAAFGDITSVVAGDGLKTGGTGGDVTVDIDVSDFAGTGLEDDGSENLRIAAAAGGNGLIGGAGSALAVGAGNGISVGANDVALGSLSSSWSIGDPYDIILDDAASELQIMESSGDTYRGTIDVGDLDDNRTYTLPNASGTLALTSDVTGDITAVVAGDGLKTGGTGGDVTVDIDVSDFAGTGLEDDGSENLRITAATAGNGLTGGAGSALAVGAGTGITVNADDVAVSVGSGFAWTADHTFTLAEAEDVNIGWSVSGTQSGQAQVITTTNSSDSGNQYGLYIDNADSSGTTEALLTIDNSDADTALTKGINFVDAGGGTTTAIDVSATSITNSINIGANPIITGNTGGTIGDNTTDSLTLTTDGTGDGEVVLPNDSVGANEIVDNTIDGSHLADVITLDTDLTFNTYGVASCNGACGGGVAGLGLSAGDIFAENNLITYGDLRGAKVRVLAKTTNYTITSTDSGSIFTNEGASGDVTLTLPADPTGIKIHFAVAAAQNLYIDPDGTDRLIRVTSSAGDRIVSVTPGGSVTLIGVNASIWVAISSDATWSDAN